MKSSRISLLIVFFLTLAHGEGAADSGGQKHFGTDEAHYKYSERIAEIGDGESGINNISWNYLEPQPPENGEHTYRWELIDARYQKIKASGRALQIDIEPTNVWACEFDSSVIVVDPALDPRSAPRKGNAIRKIKPQYRTDWKLFVEALIKRYPTEHLQIGSEAENIWSNAAGYIEAVSLAREAAQGVNPKIVIMAAGFNTAELFALSPAAQKKWLANPVAKRKLVFIQEFIKYGGGCFDVLCLHLNRDYAYIPSTVAWFKNEMKKNNYQKPVWSDDMASGHWLYDYDQIRKLKMADREAISEYRAGQSAMLVKKSVVAFSSGVDKVYVTSEVDWEHYIVPQWNYMGLLDSQGTRKPAFFTYKLMVSKLDGFLHVERVSENIYSFSFPDKAPVVVAWNDRERETIDLSNIFSVKEVAIEHIITHTGERSVDARGKVSSVKEIVISPEPVFIEAFQQRSN
ncbi:MAG: hypothetical protein WC547_11195 [Candidatus Omnitrophota bacterium]